MKKIFTLAISLAAVFGFNASADCYLLGEVEGGAWDPQNGGVQVAATGTDGVYSGTFVINGYFGVASQMSEFGADAGGWDDLNGNYRYVPGELGGDIAAEGETSLVMLPPGNGDNSFHVATPGTYTITINFNDNTLVAVAGEVTPPEPIDPPVVDNPLLTTGECYIFGAGVTGSDWQPFGVGLALTDNGDGHFVGTFEFVDGGYFSLAAKNDCVDWNELNSTYRCGAAEKDIPVEVGTPMAMAVQDASWNMVIGGTYNVDVDANAFTVTFTEGSGVQTIARDAKKSGIYNLQGMKVNEMIPGQLYIVDGKKVIATR